MLKLPSPSVSLRPEFAGDLDDRLDAKPIHFDLADAFAAMAQHVAIGVAVQVFAYLAQGVERVLQLLPLRLRQVGAKRRRRPLQNLKVLGARGEMCPESP